MKLKVAEWPIQTIDEVKLNQQELTAIKTETQTKLTALLLQIIASSTYFTQVKLDTERIEKRYVYSQYLIDPN